MSLSRAAFRTRFPGFNSASDALVDAALAEALGRIDAAKWGPKADKVQGLLAAHLLGLSPHGENARLAEDDGETTYGREYRRMLRALALGCRVT